MEEPAPGTSDAASVWTIGGIGAVLALFSRTWLDRHGDFMLLLGGLLVPVGGVLLARILPRPHARERAGTL